MNESNGEWQSYPKWSKVRKGDKLEVLKGGFWHQVDPETFWHDWGERRVNEERYVGISFHKTTEFVPPETRKLILGYPVISILRWMGERGWDEKAASKVLKRFGLLVDKKKVKEQLKLGSEGQHYKNNPIKLMKHERTQLKKIAGIKT